MDKKEEILSALKGCHPGFSVDCVVVTYHERQIKILINRSDLMGQWMLPGGFVREEEDVDDAAYRILKTRTGLENIYLQQFHLFGGAKRTDLEINRKILDALSSDHEQFELYENYFVHRFISMGYFALVNYEKISMPDKYFDVCEWFSLDNIPELYSDHNRIIEKAIGTIKLLINYLPIGSQMLPEKFIIPDLRTIYEKLLGKKLDRRNFQKKMLSTGMIERLNERKDVKTYPHPYYYRFNSMKSELNDVESVSFPWLVFNE